MTVYIQKYQREFLDNNTFTAYIGFREKGYETIFFEKKELPYSNIYLDTPVVAGIPVVISALEHLGVKPPNLPYIPKELENFTKRKMWTSTMQEARNLILEGRAVFVKPIETSHKHFSGRVFKEFKDTIFSAAVPPECPVICSDVVNFVSEYRTFVLDGEILNLKHYKGDFRVFPDISVIESGVKSYLTSPVAYAIDFGVTSKNETLLIEVNDGYSLGCYGLNPIAYSTLLEKRWLELTKQN